MLLVRSHNKTQEVSIWTIKVYSILAGIAPTILCLSRNTDEE